MEFKYLILDSFSAIGLILVFISVLFDVKYKKIYEDINENIPHGDEAKKNERIRLKTNIFRNNVPIIFFSGISFYLLLPLAVKIMVNSTISLWEFNFLATAYFFIFIWIGVVFIWSLYLCFKIIKKINNKLK